MINNELLLMLLDAVREQIAAGTPACYLFAWASPPVPIEAALGRMPEAAHVPFTPPQAGSVVHLLLSWGPDAQQVIAAHARVAGPFTAEATRSPT